MSGSNDNKQAPLVPSWQQAAPTQPDNSASPESTLDQARRFLQEEAVKDSSREKKVEFLKSKGLEEPDIANLLEESDNAATFPTSSTAAAAAAVAQPAPSPQPSATLETASSPLFENSTQPDRPPIVTYPEFLTKPLKPPPLITATGLLNSLTAIAAASTLIYGATKHLVSPMVTSLTQARVDLHATANTNLTTLVDKLERAVSELPAGYHLHSTHAHGKKSPQSTLTAATDDASSSAASSTYDDPSELFHRDVGVQTSAPPSPLPSSHAYGSSLLDNNPPTTSSTTNNPTTHQASRLAQLASTVRVLALDQIQLTEALEATKGELDAFSSDLHALTYPVESFGGGNSYLYGTANKNEPDDEIKRVKTSIRGVKGMLLSTRSFPATTA